MTKEVITYSDPRGFNENPKPLISEIGHVPHYYYFNTNNPYILIKISASSSFYPWKTIYSGYKKDM